VLGKRLARKRVRNPKAKSKSSSTAAPPPSQAAAAAAPPSMAQGGSAASWSSLPAPSISHTPTVPSVQMGSPSSINSPGDLTPMQVDTVLLYHPNSPHELHLRQAAAFRIVQNEYNGIVPPGLIRQLSTSQSSRPQTACRGRGRGHRGA
jgi:hypothetical protein